MIVTSRPRHTREIRGPAPNSYALIARPTNSQSASSRLLNDRRIKDDLTAQAAELDKLNRWIDIKNEWVAETDKKIQVSAVRRRVQSLLRQSEMELEGRRQKLRYLLERENEQYAMERSSTQSTVLDHQNALRERVRQLREQKEAQRMAFVELKLEQQFREGCEELRSTISKRQTQEMAFELLDQVKLKEEMKKARKEEDEVFAKLWYADIEAKSKREEEESRRQLSANRDTVMFQQQQIAALEAKRQQEKQLVEEEAKIMKEEDELHKLEKEREEEEKRRKNQELRDMYTQSVAQKRAQQAREMKEQEAFDMKQLEQLLEQSKAEAGAEIQKKKQLRDEERRYREYLRVMKAESARREAELEKLIDAEVEKSWEKRILQWKQEKIARQRLVEDVMIARRRQIQEKFESNMTQREEAKKERELLLQTISNNRRIEQDVKDKLIALNGQHQRDLLGQIAYNRRLRQGAANEEQHTWAVQRNEEEEFRRKVDDLRARPVLDKIHPLRRRLYLRGSPSAHF